MESKRFDVIIIGGGQAGLSVGYHLAQRGLRFVILDANERTGDSWRKRWDSLRLFTPSRYCGLDGMTFPAASYSFPTKDQMADYLEAYAARFRLPVRNGLEVERLTRSEDRYLVKTKSGVFEADQVVVAMASYQRPRVPKFARELGSDIVQLHSADYRNPSQLKPGPVLIAGAGNSGSEIALELSKRGHRVWMSGRDTGFLPFRIEGKAAQLFLCHFFLRFLFHLVLSVRTPIGRRLRPKFLGKGGPLIRVKPDHLLAAGIDRAPRVAGVQDGSPLLENGRVLHVANVVWCTGFHPGFSWIDLPIFDHAGEPLHEGGVVPSAPGLYFVGLHFLYALSSTMIHGVGRDAARIADAIVARRSVAPEATRPDRAFSVLDRRAS